MNSQENSEYNVYCFECGRMIQYDTESYYNDYNGNPICENCMVTNDNGFVCPKCGLKYPEEKRGGSGNYCKNCEEKYDY